MVISLYKNAKDLSNQVNKNKLFDFCHCQSINTGELPKKNSEFLTIIGSGEYVKQDIKKWGIHGDIMVVNFVGLFYSLKPDFNHLVSFHCDVFEHIINLRNLAIRSKPFVTHTFGNINTRIQKHINNINYVWYFKPEPRSSGLLALWIGQALGYRKILLLGIPLDNTGRFTDIFNDQDKNLYYEESSIILLQRIDPLKFDNVRSASGNTAKIFGEPTWPWIQN